MRHIFLQTFLLKHLIECVPLVQYSPKDKKYKQTYIFSKCISPLLNIFKAVVIKLYPRELRHCGLDACQELSGEKVRNGRQQEPAHNNALHSQSPLPPTHKKNAQVQMGYSKLAFDLPGVMKRAAQYEYHVYLKTSTIHSRFLI